MAHLSGSLSLCALALLCAVTIAKTDTCRTGCGGVTPNIFKYQEGTTYKYNLEGNLDISLSSAEGQHTSTKITGTVLLTQQPECNQILRLQNVQVIGPDAKKYSGLANIDKPIQLNFHDGHLEPVICTDAADTQNSLNVKRAVASLFQAALGHHGSEDDVFGSCHGEISQRKEGNNVIIHKSRDLTKCSNREAIKQDFMSTSFNLKAVAGSGPLFANYESEQRVKNGILDHVTVTENYLYKPFSDGKANGAKAIVTTKLTFAGQKKETVNLKGNEPRSIHFEAPHQEITKSANVDSILNALRETKKTMDISVTERSAKTFLHLIHVLRASKKQDILSVYGQVKTGAGGFKDKEGVRKVFFDALFRTGTGESIEVIVELLKNKELNALEQKLVYLSFSFIRHATKGSLASAAVLLDQPDLPREAYLGIGNLAGRFCSEHPCHKVDELNKLQQKLMAKLNPQPADRKAENEAIASLKALSSIHHLSDAVSDKIAAIYSSGKAPTRLRVAALEAAASDACHPKLLSTALNLLKNRQEDSELRIKAYLVLVECPDQKVAQGIKEVLENEPVYQVGGYISTHLRNLRASTNPARERAQQYLGHIRSGRSYPVDPRKYSFNTEMSSSWESAGAASNVEADVIYSQNSWVPRSVAVNVSGDVLGHRVNMIEIGARQENLDKVFEHYFGPLGVLNEHSPLEWYKTGKDSILNIVEHVKQRFEKTRGKRDVSKSEIDSFAKTIKMLGSEFNKDLDLDLNVKIFGSELLFMSINEDIQKLSPEAIIDKLFDCLDDGLDKAKNFEYHIKNHLLITDTEISYPTAMGFPLRWMLQGTAAIHFITSGQVDIRQILKDPKNAQLHLKLIPSANIEMAGSLTMDTYFVTTGLKITANLLTSTGSDLTVKLLDHNGVDIKLGLPVEKQKLVSFSHNLEFSTTELGKPEVVQPLKFKDKQRDFTLCFDQLSQVIGLTFCGEFNAPTTLVSNHVAFPFNGNFNFEVAVQRDDVHEYHFQAVMSEPNAATRTATITFDTPGSKVNRHLTLIVEASTSPTQHLRATLKSPFKEAVAEVVLTDTEAEKSAMVRFQHDNHEYMAKLGVSVKGGAEKQIYQPLIEYSTPGDVVKTKGNRKPDYTVEGQVIVEKHGDTRKFTFDHVKLISPDQPAIQINGYFSREGPTSYSTDLQVSRDSVNVVAKGKLQYGEDHLKLNAELQNSVNPSGNFNIKIDLKKGEKEYENSMVLIHGPDLSSKKHCLTISQSAKYSTDQNNPEITAKNKITYPLLGLEGKLDYHVSKKHYKYDMTAKYEKFKMESELDAKLAEKHVGDYDVKFEIEVMNNKLHLKAKRELDGDKSKVNNLLEISGRKYQVDGTIIHHVKPDDLNIGTDLVIKVHDKPEAIKIDTGLISNLQTLDSHVKILVGSNALVDIVIKGSRGTNPAGNLKIIIQKVIIANGNFKVTGGKGTGQIVVEIPKIARKIKAEGQFTCQDPTHNALLNIYFDFEKDNSKKLHIETNNQVTKESYDTKNKIDLMGQTITFNSNGQLTGVITHGTITGQFDLTLPNKEVLSGTLNRQLAIVEKVANGNAHITLQYKQGSDVHKFDITGALKDTNMDKGIFHGEWKAVAGKVGGKEAKADLLLSHQLDGETHHSICKTKLHGSMFPHPLALDLEGTYTEESGTHSASLLYGAHGGKMHTKYNTAGAKHPGQPVSGALDLEFLLNDEAYKSVKLGMEGTVTKPETEEGTYEASGSVTGILNNEKTAKLGGNFKATKHSGEVHVDLALPKHGPLGFTGKYNTDKTENGDNLHGDIHLNYGNDIKAGLTLNKLDEDEADLELTLNNPASEYKNINLHLKSKRSSNQKHFNNEVILTADGKKYSASNELIISEDNPLLDILVSYPDGKQSRILLKFNRLGPKEYKGEVKIQSIQDFSLEASGDANLESVDNFHILVNIHSEKLKLDKVKFEASNKPAKGGKKIQFSAKSGDKNLLSGSTSYKANEEGGKYIVEGSGSVKVKDETRTATFKYMKQQLEQEKDGETGVEVLLNAGVGSQGIVAELKLTNKQFRVLNSYCEEKKQCAHVEVFSKTNNVAADEFNNELEINIDLRKLGLSHEFGLKAVTNRKDFVLDHTVDVHFESSAASKYQYSVYIHPKEAGIQFTTPKRVVSLEAKGESHRAKGKQGPTKVEIALYMNKKAEPNKKTVLSYSENSQVDDNSGNSNMEMKFSTPGLAKDMLITYVFKYDVPTKKAEYTIDLDIFAKKNQKINIVGTTGIDKVDGGYKWITNVGATSKGFNLDFHGTEYILATDKDLVYDLKINYQLDKTKLENNYVFRLDYNQLEILLKVFNKDLVHVDSSLQIRKDSRSTTSTIRVIGFDDISINSELKNFNTYTATIGKLATPQNKLRLTAGFVVGQIADIRLECEKGGSKTDVAHVSVKLDDANFFKPDFNVNSDFIQKHLVPAIEKENQKGLVNLKAVIEDNQKILSNEIQHMNDVAKKSVPNMKPAAEYYKQELLKLKEELVSDKTIQEVSDFLKKVFGAVASTIANIYTKLAEMSDTLVAITSENFSKITDVIAKDILPLVKEFVAKLLGVYLEIMKDVYDLVMLGLVKISELLKEHQEELKHVATVFSEAFQDFGRIFVKFFTQMREDIEALLKDIYEQLKALPIFEELQQRYQELVGGLPVPDQILGLLDELCGTVKDVMPTEEAKQFISTLQDYIGRKLRKEQIDDTESFKQIYTAFIRALNSLIKFIQNQQDTAGADYNNIYQNIIPLRFDRFTTLPQIAAAKFSPINYLFGGDYPSLKSFFIGQSFHPRDNIPPFAHHGIIVQGQHIFTFDDRHLTFPGKCSYVLAKDAVNGNFTIVGQYKDGAMEGLTFADKHDVVTLKKNLQVTHNGKAAELPIRTKDVEVFRLYNTIQIVSKAGVHIIAEPHLEILSVYVSGFYHSQLRGLLGNGNFEPYDDFIMPNGKITNSEADFGNGYKLQAGCGAVATVDHSTHHANPKCDELFGADSDFEACYPFVPAEGYRQACEHGVAAGVAHTEKYIGLAYVIRCHARNIPIEMPNDYLQCTNGEKSTPLNEHFSVKTPTKAADVIVVVQQNKANEAVFKDLVQPVITQLTNELNAKGVSDVEFSIIGYGGDYSRYPSHYTQGGKLAFHGAASALKFSDPAPETPIDLGCQHTQLALERFNHFIEETRHQLLLTPEMEALREAMRYPFRAHASKVVIWARGENPQKFSTVGMLLKYISVYSRKDGVHISVLQPMESLKSASGKDASKLKNIVGFNKHGAYTLADAKKKGDGNAELKKDLDWGLDHAVDYVFERHDGNIFVANTFTAAKGGQKKQFVQVMTHVIAEDIINHEYTMDCECQRNNVFSAQNVCKVVSVKEKEPKKGGVKG